MEFNMGEGPRSEIAMPWLQWITSQPREEESTGTKGPARRPLGVTNPRIQVALGENAGGSAKCRTEGREAWPVTFHLKVRLSDYLWQFRIMDCLQPNRAWWFHQLVTFSPWKATLSSSFETRSHCAFCSSGWNPSSLQPQPLGLKPSACLSLLSSWDCIPVEEQGLDQMVTRVCEPMTNMVCDEVCKGITPEDFTLLPRLKCMAHCCLNLLVSGTLGAGFFTKYAVSYEMLPSSVARDPKKTEAVASIFTLTPASISILTPAPVSILTPAPVSILTPAPVSILTPAPVSILTPASVSILTPASVSILTPACVSILTPASVSILTPASVSILTPASVSILTSASVFILTPASVFIFICLLLPASPSCLQGIVCQLSAEADPGPALRLICNVTLSQLLNYIEPQFPLPDNGNGAKADSSEPLSLCQESEIVNSFTSEVSASYRRGAR
ncbi:Signal transducer and activator of transcription 2 [Plecturocebus cupreus]